MKIECNAWDVHSKIMVSWKEIFKSKGYTYDLFNNINENLIPLPYTSIMDSKGGKIHLGDIVGIQVYSDYSLGVVKWDERYARYTVGSYDLGYAKEEGFVKKIRGNIYENKELLT